jgi:hypothetical protein
VTWLGSVISSYVQERQRRVTELILAAVRGVDQARAKSNLLFFVELGFLGRRLGRKIRSMDVTEFPQFPESGFGTVTATAIVETGVVSGSDVSGCSRVRVEVGAGAIQGGTELYIQRILLMLNSSVLEFQGDSTLVTDAEVGGEAISVSTGHPGPAKGANSIVFEFSRPLVIPANSNRIARLEFDLKHRDAQAEAGHSYVIRVAGWCDNGAQVQAVATGWVPWPCVRAR